MDVFITSCDIKCGQLSGATGGVDKCSLIFGFIMPYEVNSIGFCSKCAKCIQPCDHLERSPHLDTSFQTSVADNRSCEYDVTVKRFTLCTYNVGYNVEVTELVDFLKKEPSADIVCVQELLSRKVNHLLEFLRESRWSYYALSPHCRSIILSTFPLEEVCRARLGGNYEFVAVKVQGFYLTSLHLTAKNEATRLNQLEKIRVQMSQKGVWDHGRIHIFAGDFNSLTKADKSQEGWDKVAAEKELSNTERLGEKGFTKLEEPKFDVTSSMAEKNFSDCWAMVGRGKLKTTCQ